MRMRVPVPGAPLAPHDETTSPSDVERGDEAGEARSLISGGSSKERSGAAASQYAQKALCLAGGIMLMIFFLAVYTHASSPGKAGSDSAPAHEQSFGTILSKASHRALGGGIGGAVAGVCQVLALMWLRTAMNYQYRHGGRLVDVLHTLYGQGGIPRFYQGLPFALLQTPLSRFGDTAANVGVLAIFAAAAPAVPLGVRTACASFSGSLWRILITPFDTLKTSLQVEGPAAYELLLRKARSDGMLTLWNGALGNAFASFVGSYPWFMTFNFLDEVLPRAAKAELGSRLLRSAAMGFAATGVSDCISNSVRVVKTTRQTAAEQVGYAQAARMVVAADGVRGLLCRGLGTRLLANALQSALFTIVWKLIESELNSTAR